MFINNTKLPENCLLKSKGQENDANLANLDCNELNWRGEKRIEMSRGVMKYLFNKLAT